MILLHLTIIKCILIKYFYHIKLHIMHRYDKSISTYTGSTVKDMYDPNKTLIFRADGHIQQVRGMIWYQDSDNCIYCFHNNIPDKPKIKELKLKYRHDFIDHRR